MIPIKSFKLKCPKCGYSKIVNPKSDVLNPIDFITTCAMCKGQMVKKDINFVDELMNILE